MLPLKLPSLEFDSLAIEITPYCNQSCIYCYNGWRALSSGRLHEPDLPTLKKWIDILLNQARFRFIVLTGGEPFLHPHIHQLIDYINSRGPGVIIISNGGRISGETAARLASQQVHYIQFTLGGADAETHDGLCGAGSFAGLQLANSHLRQEGISRGGSYLCTSRNRNQAADIMQLFNEFGIRQVAFNRFNPSGEARKTLLSLLPTRSDVLSALQQVDHQAAACDMKVVSTMPLPPCVLDTAEYPHIEFAQCAAGTHQAQFALGTDGKLRLCTLQKHAIGSIEDTSLLELCTHSRVKTFRAAIPPFCLDCPLAPDCLGGCGASAEWIFGSPAELDPFVAQHVMQDFKARIAFPTAGELPRA